MRLSEWARANALTILGGLTSAGALVRITTAMTDLGAAWADHPQTIASLCALAFGVGLCVGDSSARREAILARIKTEHEVRMRQLEREYELEDARRLAEEAERGRTSRAEMAAAARTPSEAALVLDLFDHGAKELMRDQGDVCGLLAAGAIVQSGAYTGYINGQDSFTYSLGEDWRGYVLVARQAFESRVAQLTP